MDVARSFQPGVLTLVTSVIVIVLALVILVLRDRIGLWATTYLSTSHPELAIVQLYTRMVRTVERHGIQKHPSATANEFASLVEHEWKPAGPIVADVIALYQQGRFSRTPLTPGQLSHAAEQVGKLQSLIHVVR
jgi:hypothetical protein